MITAPPEASTVTTLLLTCEQDRVLTVHQLEELPTEEIVFTCQTCGLQTALAVALA